MRPSLSRTFLRPNPSRIVGVDKANDLAILQANQDPKFFFQLSAEEPALLQNIYATGFLLATFLELQSR